MALALVADSGSDIEPAPDEGWTLQRGKEAYLDYLNSKTKEIEEQKVSRKYDSGNQLTDSQIKALDKRGMAPIIKNHITKKIDGMIGTLARLKADPKAYPVTDKHQEGADLATKTVNVELDEADFDTIQLEAARYAAVDAIGGVEMVLTPSKIDGDYDPSVKLFDPADYFYDPRTFSRDFSDCRYDGIGMWKTLEEADDMFPGKEEQLRNGVTDSGTDLSSEPSKDDKWFITNGQNIQKLRIVECWYRWKGGYRWMIFTGSSIIDQGEGYFYDGKGEQVSKYIKFAARRDEQGDVYSFIRTMRYYQDMINAQSMGLLYDQKSRRIIIEGEDIQNTEKIRAEWARPDGTIVLPQGAKAYPDDKTADIQGALASIAENVAAIEQFGLNANIFGDKDPNLSGRAISLLQQAGLAELGPFLVEYKRWKITVYRYMWAAIQRYWSGERLIRVTDDEDIVQFVKVNELGIDPATGRLVLQNALGDLDVDIKMDEGPDAINAMDDSYQSLLEAQSRGAQIPPRVLIMLAPLDRETKDAILAEMDKAAQPDPTQQQAVQQQLQLMNAQIQKLESEAAKNMAAASNAGPTRLDNAQQVADIQKTLADADKSAFAAQGAEAPAPDILSDLEQVARINKLNAEARARTSVPTVPQQF